MEKFCNIEVFYKNGVRKSFLNVPRNDKVKFCEPDNAVLVLVAYKVYAAEIFNESRLEMYTRTPTNDYTTDYHTSTFECDDPIYLFAQKMIYDRLFADNDKFSDLTGEYLSPSNRAALE